MTRMRPSWRSLVLRLSRTSPAYRLCCVTEQRLGTEAGAPKAARAEPVAPDLPRPPEGAGKAA